MRPAKVLIVEDEMIFALDLSERLKSGGYEICDLTASGEKAVENCRNQRPDIALIDISLRGDSSGIQTAREIRERFSVPVIFMTGYADAKTRGAAETVKPAAYLIKPFEIGELLDAIQSALERKQE